MAHLTGLLFLFPSFALLPEVQPLRPVQGVRVISAAEQYPGGRYSPGNLVDGKVKTEYSSKSLGTDTFVLFEFERPEVLGGFMHRQRNDPATVAASRLQLFNEKGELTASFQVKHVNRPGAETFFCFPRKVRAKRVRWQVVRLGSRYSTVGGAEIAFFKQGAPEKLGSSIEISIKGGQIAERAEPVDLMPVEVKIYYPYCLQVEAELTFSGLPPKRVRLSFGGHSVSFRMPAVKEKTDIPLSLRWKGDPLAVRTLSLEPLRRLTVYVLPHSHTDIGYTEPQAAVEDKQIDNLLQAIAYARATAAYPPGARFVWNVEVLWAADLYMRRLGPSERRQFIEAVKRGWVELCGLYLNELTGLCRPEELLRLCSVAERFRRLTGAPVDAAMISDVPGYTWGTVTALSQAGIKYLSAAPNYFDRIGTLLVTWENKPFYWVGPSGKEKVLLWMPFRGYATSHIYRRLDRSFVEKLLSALNESGYPYDIAYLRWAGHGDNAPPDPALSDQVKAWNEKYSWPRFVIAGAGEAFRAFEAAYGKKLPSMRGDLTPYWEDGAASSAAETAVNRLSADRLQQAEALWALKQPGTYPKAQFWEAWRKVLLYSEHTWGAWCSVSRPLSEETLRQWEVKRSYAVAADVASRRLLSCALSIGRSGSPSSAVDVFNTCSWKRTDLVIVPRYLSAGKTRVVDSAGEAVPSQRLRSGELAFLAKDVPPLCAKRYFLQAGPRHVEGAVVLKDFTLRNQFLKVRLDRETGAVKELTSTGSGFDFAGKSLLNQYLYFLGSDPSKAQSNGPVTIQTGERGPLVASLVVSSPAPGCYTLRREVLLVWGLPEVRLRNLIDKKRLVAGNYFAPEGKESVNFAFPFHVPGGQVRIQVPFGVVRPDEDQLPGSCKNWFTLCRWADVSNDKVGVSLISLHAPLVQVGGLTANLLNSQTDPAVWRKAVGTAQSLYPWVMNNHWGTNYRAFQEGPVEFSFVLLPHGPLDTARVSRRAIELSSPLIATAPVSIPSIHKPLLLIDKPNVLLLSLKPSGDRKALVLRLWESAGRETKVRLTWRDPQPAALWLSDLSESRRQRIANELTIAPFELVTLRADLPESR